MLLYNLFAMQFFGIQIKSILSLYPLYHAEACNEFSGPISASLRLRATQLLSKKCGSGGKPLTTLGPIRPAQDLNLRPFAPETNALPLVQN